MNEWVNEWMSDWLNEWMSEWVNSNTPNLCENYISINFTENKREKREAHGVEVRIGATNKNIFLIEVMNGLQEIL